MLSRVENGNKDTKEHQIKQILVNGKNARKIDIHVTETKL